MPEPEEDEDSGIAALWNAFWRGIEEWLGKKSVEPDMQDDTISGTVSMPIESTGYDREKDEERIREKIIDYARSQLGVPYKLGAEVDLDDL